MLCIGEQYNKMKTIQFFIGLIFLSAIIAFSGCSNYENGNSDSKTQAAQEKIIEEGNAQTGLPAIKNFQEKKLMKQIYELRDNEKLICYAYLYNEFNGKLVFIGKCIGYGLPYATQFSNPEKIITLAYFDKDRVGANHYAGTDPQTIPQAEPNGLFMPQSAEATWVMLLDSAGIPHPVYVEPKVIISPFKLDI